MSAQVPTNLTQSRQCAIKCFLDASATPDDGASANWFVHSINRCLSSMKHEKRRIQPGSAHYQTGRPSMISNPASKIITPRPMINASMTCHWN
jgi:hypothetical protein